MDGISFFILILVKTEMRYAGAVYPSEFTTFDATADCLVDGHNYHVAQNKHYHMKNRDFDSYNSCLRRNG